MKKTLTLCLFIFLTFNTLAQVIYVSSIGTQLNGLYRLDLADCNYEFVVNIQSLIFDISFHPNGNLYGVAPTGELYEIDIINGNTTLIHSFAVQFYNSLTIASDGLIYATGDPAKIYSYDISSNTETYHGDLGPGFSASGDLSFFEGDLYVAVNGDRIVKVNIDNPANSTVVINENIPGDIFGIVSFAEDCSDVNSYAITGETASTGIYQIDFANNSLNYICDIDLPVGGGASTFEFLASSPLLIQNISEVNVSCGVSGSITVLATGGVGEITYSIDGINFQTSNSFDNLIAGDYTISIQDDNDCVVTEEVNLSTDNSPTITDILPDNINCENANGSITISVTDGTGLIEYSLDGINFQTSNIFDNLPLGNYTLTVRDENNCLDSETTAIVFEESPNVTNIFPTNATCGNNNGSIDISVTGGTGLIEYSLDGINFQTSNIFDNLPPDNYTLTVRDENNCLDSETATILPEDIPNITEITSANSTCGNDNGSINILVTDGTGLIEYSLDGINFQNSNIFNNLPPGNYTLTVRDDNNCLDSETTTILPEDTPSIIDVISVGTTCENDNGSITILASGGIGQIAYSIDGINFQSSNNFENLAAGNYTVTIQDVNNCQETQAITIDQGVIPLAQSIDIIPTFCGKPNGEIIIETSDENLEFSIDGTTYQQDNFFNDLAAGDYRISIRDENNCISTDEIVISRSTQLSINSIQTAPANCGESTGIFLIDVGGGTGIIQISLNGGTYQSDSFFEGLSAGVYDIQIIDEVACSLDTSIVIEQAACPIYVPNAFSPNGDGQNDLFKIYPHPVFSGEFKSFKIFDRWGANIFEAENFDPANTSWDGTYKGKKLDMGVYAYFVEYISENGDTELLEGEITIVE